MPNTQVELRTETIEIAGEQITVSEFTLGQLPQVLGVIDEMRQAGKFTINLANKETGQSDEYIQSDFVHGLLQSGEIGIKLLTLATGKEQDWLKQIGLAMLPKLARAIFNVNQGIFQEFGGLIAEMQSMVSILGKKPAGSAANEA